MSISKKNKKCLEASITCKTVLRFLNFQAACKDNNLNNVNINLPKNKPQNACVVNKIKGFLL